MIKRISASALGAILLLSVTVSAETPELPSDQFPVPEQTWQYLEANPPGTWDILVSSLGHREIRDESKTKLYADLDTGLDQGFSNVSILEKGIISLVKLEENPQNYKKNNLVAMLHNYENLYQNGLNGAIYALMAYESVHSTSANDSSLPAPNTVRNSTSAIIDYIVSAQQRSGGFAATTGRDPDIQVTARAVTVLSSYRDIPYVNAAVEKAIDWLAAQQDAEGTYSLKKVPDCMTTASVMIALNANGISMDDPRFVKDGNDLLSTLSRFENTDGGYATAFGQPSCVEATQVAVIIRCMESTGLLPHLAPNLYPGYVEPEMDGKLVYLVFFMKFIGILAILYFVIIITNKIGKKWGDKPIRLGATDDIIEKSPKTADRQTLEINIPMKAELPDFDSISESDTTPDKYHE